MAGGSGGPRGHVRGGRCRHNGSCPSTGRRHRPECARANFAPQEPDDGKVLWHGQQPTQRRRPRDHTRSPRERPRELANAADRLAAVGSRSRLGSSRPATGWWVSRHPIVMSGRCAGGRPTGGACGSALGRSRRRNSVEARNAPRRRANQPSGRLHRLEPFREPCLSRPGTGQEPSGSRAARADYRLKSVCSTRSPALMPRRAAVPALSSRTASTGSPEGIVRVDRGSAFSATRAIEPSGRMNSMSRDR